jgi:hypothetical protein
MVGAAGEGGMMRRVSVLLIVFTLCACESWWNVEPTYDPRFADIPVIGIGTPAGAGRWLMNNITFTGDDIHDTPEYWQSPDQTYVWRAGDCEDYVILAMYLIRVEIGGWPEMIVGDHGVHVGNGHAWLSYAGRWYEPQTGDDVTDNPDYVLEETIPYGEAMWRSMNRHKSMKEIMQ